MVVCDFKTPSSADPTMNADLGCMLFAAITTKGVNFQPTFNSYLCGEHFLSSDFNFSYDKNKLHLLPSAVQSIFTFSLE